MMVVAQQYEVLNATELKIVKMVNFMLWYFTTIKNVKRAKKKKKNSQAYRMDIVFPDYNITFNLLKTLLYSFFSFMFPNEGYISITFFKCMTSPLIGTMRN